MLLSACVFIHISRYTVVYRVAQEAVAPHCESIDRKTKNVIFTSMYNSEISYLNSTKFAAEMLPN